MRFDIITIFPELFNGFISESLLAKAQLRRSALPKSESRPKASGNKPLITIKTHYLRKWTHDRHQTARTTERRQSFGRVDGKPYGGGPGLVMKIEPIHKAVTALKNLKISKLKPSRKVILFSPRGRQLDQATVQRWAKLDQLIFICGRYEGVDERVAEYIADEMVSVGPYVLNGGEVPAMVAIEAVSRLIPGFMHDPESATKEDHAQYTKPEVFSPSRSDLKNPTKVRPWRVPKVLLSGDHAKVKEWRLAHTKVPSQRLVRLWRKNKSR